jgi:hypothetical protein
VLDHHLNRVQLYVLHKIVRLKQDKKKQFFQFTKIYSIWK